MIRKHPRALARAALMIVGALCLLAISACGEPLMGDPGYSVIVKNGMTEPLMLFVDDVGAKPGGGFFDGVRLEPGAENVDHWLIPGGPQDDRRAKVRVMTSTGELFYCHKFGFADLQRIQFHILIGPGVNDCGTP